MWLSLDNTEVKKANMSGMFKVNLAFFRNINTPKCVDYNIDFADIKQGCARRHPPLLVKGHPNYLEKKGKGKKSSAQPQLNIPDDAFKEFLNQGGNIQNEVSEGDKQEIQPKSTETTSTDMMSENALAAFTSVESQLKNTVNEPSEGEPGTVPIPESISSNSREILQVPQGVYDEHATLESTGDNVLTNSTEVHFVSPEKSTVQSTDDNVGTKSSEIEKDTRDDQSEPNTHSKALPPNPSQDQPSTSDESPKAKGGCSAADMAPLEFKKDCLLVLRGTLISSRRKGR